MTDIVKEYALSERLKHFKEYQFNVSLMWSDELRLIIQREYILFLVRNSNICRMLTNNEFEQIGGAEL